MQYGYNEIIEYFKKNQDANFVAFMRTAWHSYGATASLIKLSETGKLNGLLLSSVEDYNNPCPLIDVEIFNILNQHNVKYENAFQKSVDFPKSKVELLKFKLAPVKYFTNHKKGTRKIYVIKPLHTADWFVAKLKKAIPQAEIINVITDEGLGSYFRTPLNWAVENYKNNSDSKHGAIRFFESLISQGLAKYYEKKANKQNELINFNLLCASNKGFVPNGNVADYYKKTITNNLKTDEKLEHYENCVIISAQLYYETGQMKKDCDLKLYQNIISSLKEKGIKVVFKPHPRDKNIQRYDCLNCYVDNENTSSQESIIASLKQKPLGIISFTSTSLITANLFYGVNAFSINNCIEKNMLESSLISEFKGFEKRFGNIVNVVDSVEDLTNLFSGR